MTDARTIEVTGLFAGIGAASPGAHKGGGALLEVTTAGPDAGKQLLVRDRPVKIGSEAPCELVLTDKSVSRAHAEVRAHKGGVLVADLGSTNGTRVAGQRVLEGSVAFGGELAVGNTTLRVLEAQAPRLPASTRTRFGGLIGTSRVMREVFAVLEAASPTEATILLEGPSGTGKEVTARAIHDHSPRAGGAFVAFDAGSTSRDLLQSALMGHKKGAFTGAQSDRAGAFVEAHGGTLFLDEIGELPLESQSHLLRVLEVGEVTPVGGDKPRKVDVRVVAATNRDLFAMVGDGKFRLDLFHRLAVVHLRLPALKERAEDIAAIVRGLYEGRGLEAGDVSGDNLERLKQYAFPGNVRELRNILERSWVLAPKGKTTFAELTLWLGPNANAAAAPALGVDTSLPFKDAKEALLARFEAAYLGEVMAQHDDNVSAAARHAGISRKHMRVLLVKHGLRVPAAADDASDGDDDDAGDVT